MHRSQARLFLLFLLVLLLVVPGSGFAGEPSQRLMTDTVKEAREAGVSTTTLNHLLTIGYEYRVPAEAIVPLIKVITIVSREKLPIEPFVSKIEEGLAKRVSPSLIQQALAKKLREYRFIQSVLSEIARTRSGNERVSSEDLLRLSESLSYGITQDELQTFLKQAPSSSSYSAVTIAVETFASLQQNQFNPAIAQKIAIAGLRQDFFTPTQRDLARIMVVAKQKGVSEAKIADTALETIQKKGSLNEMASRLGVTSKDLSHGPSVGSSHGGQGNHGESHQGGSGGSHGGTGDGGHGGGQGGGEGGGHGGGHM